MRHFLVFSLLVLFSGPADAQRLSDLVNRIAMGRYSLQTAWQYGGVFNTNDFVDGKNASGVPIDRHRALSVRLARQTTGAKTWEQLYAWPRYGIGLFMADFNSRELGRPLSCFGFLTGPFFRMGPFSLNYDLAMGLAFNWNRYDPVTNPYNTAIGSIINSHIEAGIGTEFQLTPRISAGAGYGLTHFSNGGITPPNRGINTHFWKFNCRVELYSADAIQPRKAIEKFRGQNEWTLAGYTGFKNKEIPITVDPHLRQPTVPVYATGIIGAWHRQVDYKSKLGAGIALGYNGIINPQFLTGEDTVYLDRHIDLKRLEISAFPSYQLKFNHFSLIIQAGFYLYRNQLIGSSPVFYQRLGFRYDFTEHYFGALQLRARDFDTAEMIEWTVGYRF